MKSKNGKAPILVPVDFSTHSKNALLKASELAECARRPLIVVHVVHDPAEMPGYYGQVVKKKKLVRIQDLAREAYDEFLRSTIEEHPEARLLKDAERLLVIGLPVSRILEVVEKTQPSMVVIGSQGRTGLAHLMLGSKAEQIARLCPVTVTIVKS